MIDGRIDASGAAVILVDESNEAQRRMRVRVQQLLLERGKAPAQHVGLGQAELMRESIEQASFRMAEIDLDWRGLGDPPRSPSRSVMIISHES